MTAGGQLHRRRRLLLAVLLVETHGLLLAALVVEHLTRHNFYPLGIIMGDARPIFLAMSLAATNV